MESFNQCKSYIFFIAHYFSIILIANAKSTVTSVILSE